MTLKILVVVPVIIVGIGIATGASAQQGADPFVYCQDTHVKPGQGSELEAGVEDRNARFARANVTYGFATAVSDRGVYRNCTFGLPNMAALDERRAQLSGVEPNAVGRTRRAAATARFETSVYRSRPEESFRPVNPRVPREERGFFREFSFYTKGTGGVRNVLQRFRALVEERDIRMGYLVQTRAVGSGPNLRLWFFARDATDFYAEWPRMVEQMGDEFRTLAAELFALSDRTDQTNWTLRRDLGYQPAN
jgi:hypothetical protein